jgi:HD-like signal output (HDOD) protein/prolyl-tRNA editing enzyme YbaK/EbsC (Cys-tRNA(Pro) deacylase)
MSLPAKVEAILRDSDVEFTTLELKPRLSVNEWEQPGAVQTQLVRNGKLHFQAIFPAQSMLDIQALSRLTGYQLTGYTEIETYNLCQNSGFSSLPGLPFIADLPTIIDKSLLAHSQLTLDGGDGENAILVSTESYRRLLRDSIIGEFSIPLNGLAKSQLDNVHDLDDITKAVANFTQVRIKQRIEETLDFPPLPDTAQRIIKLRVNPYANINDLVDIVETDAPLAAQVVSWAASPYYAAPGKIQSIHDAIVRVLGFDLVLNLSLGLSLGNMLQLPKDSPKGFTPYWLQSVYTATTMEALVNAIPAKKRPTVGLAYLSGLLHNFGYLLLAEIFPPHFSHYCRQQEANPRLNHAYIERHLLGITREQISAWLMQVWNMPLEIVNAMRFQNEAEYTGEDSVYANLLFITSRLLRQRGIGDAPLETIPLAIYERIGLDPVKAQEILDNIIESEGEIREMAHNLNAAAS